MQPAFTNPLSLPPHPHQQSHPRKRHVSKRRFHHPRCATTPPNRLSDLPQRDDKRNHDHGAALPDGVEEIPLELVDGYLDNAKVRPKIDIDADEYMLMWKLRRMLHEDDFNRIFDQKSRRIGEL